MCYILFKIWNTIAKSNDIIWTQSHEMESISVLKQATDGMGVGLKWLAAPTAR